MSLNTLATSNWHWISGEGEPSPYAGYIEDFYIDLLTNEVYRKVDYHLWEFVGVWSAESVTSGAVSINFSTLNWSGDTLLVIPAGIPGPGQIGPHNIPAGYVLYSQVKMKTGNKYEDVFIEIDYDIITNTVLITKTSSYPAFDGSILLSYAIA